MTKYELTRYRRHLEAALRCYRDHTPIFRSVQEMAQHYEALDDCKALLDIVKTKKGSDEK